MRRASANLRHGCAEPDRAGQALRSAPRAQAKCILVSQRCDPKALEQVPEELVVHLVVELDFLSFDERSQGPRAAIGGALLQVRIAAFHIVAEQACRPLRLTEVSQ